MAAQIQGLERLDDWTTASIWHPVFEMWLQNVSVDSDIRTAVRLMQRHVWRTCQWMEVTYLPSFCWCLTSDFKAVWMSSWLKTSLCGNGINKTNVNTSFNVVWPPLFPYCTVRPAKPSAPWAGIYYSCVCSVLLLTTLCVCVYTLGPFSRIRSACFATLSYSRVWR